MGLLLGVATKERETPYSFVFGPLDREDRVEARDAERFHDVVIDGTEEKRRIRFLDLLVERDERTEGRARHKENALEVDQDFATRRVSDEGEQLFAPLLDDEIVIELRVAANGDGDVSHLFDIDAWCRHVVLLKLRLVGDVGKRTDRTNALGGIVPEMCDFQPPIPNSCMRRT